MFLIFLLTFFFVNIGFRARARGLNPGVWVLAAIMSVFAAIFLSMLIMMFSWMKQYNVALEQLQAMLEGNEIQPTMLNELFLYICASGGYLLIRYLLDRRAKALSPPNDDENG